jgi:hypothetical protein
MGPRTGLEVLEGRKIPDPAGNRTQIVQPIASYYADMRKHVKCWEKSAGERFYANQINTEGNRFDT